MTKDEIRKGIAAYHHSQQVLLRLIRKQDGGLTASKFDALFIGREWRRPTRLESTTDDSFILGLGLNGGSQWADTLTLLQWMVAVDLVDMHTDKNNEIFYKLHK